MWLCGMVLLIGALVGLDQASKWLADTCWRTAVPLWEDVLELTYLENRGAAWGMGQGFRWVFVVFTTLVVAAILYFLVGGRARRMGKMFTAACVLIAAGGIGNWIDRVFHGYVIDFIYVKWIHFPVFNIADCCVVIGAILLGIWTLFLYQGTEKSVKEGAHGAERVDSDTAGGGATARSDAVTDALDHTGDSAEVADTTAGDGQREDTE